MTPSIACSKFFCLAASIGFLAVATPAFAQFRLPRIPVRPAPGPRFIPVPLPGMHPSPGAGKQEAGNSIFDSEWFLWIVGGLIAAFVGLILMVVLQDVWQWWTKPQRTIRVTSTPPGDAPEAIRKAWIGVELPLVPGVVEPEDHFIASIRSGELPGMRKGYTVHGKAAIKRLAGVDTEAADWWKKNVPDVTGSDFIFLFPFENCELLEESLRQR